jgi:uncharacterized membrane protein
MTRQTFDTKKIVLLAILTAIVIALQIAAIVTRPLFPMFSITLVLVPIVIGAALIGAWAGAWLGLVFGFAVLISGDAAPFMVIDPFGTVTVVLIKGMLAGLAAGFVYKLLSKKDKTIAAIIAAIVCPLVNTGIFIVGSYVFFLPTLTEWGAAAGYASATAFIFLAMVGLNFLVELAINFVLSPTIVRLIQYRSSAKSE